ncbi:MAG: hypothetical protein M3498_06845 [Deinococcota bacterium]|jgi:hypothetical protein|nr:hypothetical protein [Deinococcota bacterium]
MRWTRQAAGFSRGKALLCWLVAADLLFISLHFVHVRWGSALVAWSTSTAFRIDTDQGFAELFQYLKLILIIWLLSRLFLKCRYGTAGAWAVVFTFVLLDDAFMLHERLGVVVGNRVAPPLAYGLGSHEVGELLVWAVAGVTMGSLVLLAHLRSSREGRIVSRGLLILFAALVFFGLGVDVLHNILSRKHLADALLQSDADRVTPVVMAAKSLLHGASLSTTISTLTVLPALYAALLTVGEAVQGAMRLDLMFTLVEDGGEMIVVSLIAAYILRNV